VSSEIGFIGLGSMGSEMVRRFVESGLGVWVHDSDRGAVGRAVAWGARAASSPAEVANQVEIVLVSLPTPDVVRAVALGADGLVNGSKLNLYVDLSTTGTSVAHEVAAVFTKRGIGVLDAPVSGGPAFVKNGTLTIMAAGEREVFERVKPLLQIIGSGTTHVGDKPGQGQILKLVNNLLLATTYVATCEAAALATKAGIDPEVLVSILNKSSGRSFSSEILLTKQGITRKFNHGFRLRLMHKDVRLALQNAEDLGVTMILSGLAGQIWSHAMTNLDPDGDYSAMLKVVEAWSHVVVGNEEAAAPAAT
jgi:3-hydroxyisobutyrate dehydrogenase-like beta-hydroxyacid dehydrogenase